jgi:predicted DNA-binding ribbon-helix-helix protein
VETGATRQITLRLPEPLYQTIKCIAEQQQVSLNRLMQRSLEQMVGEAQVRELRAAYEVLGTDAEANDVQAFFAAQSEVVGHDPA